MLDAGVYTAVLEYVPLWNDDVLAAQRAGRVTSNAATVTVAPPAPPTVSRRGVLATVEIARHDAFLVATLTNRSDQPLLVNKNFGTAVPFARGHWVYELETERHEVPFERRSGLCWHDFQADRLVPLPPGETTTLARVRADELHRALTDAGVPLDNARGSLHFEYDNLCGRTWQRRQGSALIDNASAPAVFRTLLPRRLLTNRQVSNRLSALLAD